MSLTNPSKSSDDSEAQYASLLRSLRRRKGFGILFVQCSPSQGEQLIDRVKKDLPQKKIEALKFDQPVCDGNVYQQVEQFLSQKPADILFIQGLEYSLYDYEETKRHLGWSSEDIYSYNIKDAPPVMVNLNQQRERFRDTFNTCFVFIVPLFVIKYFIHRAPDFFDWRSGLFKLPSAPDVIEQASKQIVLKGNYGEYSQLTSQQRNQELLEIQIWLEEPYQTLERRADLFFMQGLLFFAAEEYQSSLIAYDKVLELKPDNYPTWIIRAIVLGELGHNEGAMASYNKAIELKPDNYLAWASKGIALDELGYNEEAIASYNKAVELKSDEHEIWLTRGNALFKLGRNEEALISYDRAIELKPDDHTAWYNRVNVLFNLGRSEEAIASYDKAIELKPGDYMDWIVRGSILPIVERNEEAIDSYNKAIELEPNQYLAWYVQGNALYKLGRYEEAISSYDKALKLKPDYDAVWHNRGLVLSSLGRNEEAIVSYDKAIELKSNNPDSWYGKAYCYVLLEDIENAIENLQRAIELDPEYREIAKTDADFDAIREDDRFRELVGD